MTDAPAPPPTSYEVQRHGRPVSRRFATATEAELYHKDKDA